MAKFRSIKNSLLGGQISPSAEGRTDLPQYASACKLLKNMIPKTVGGSYRRPGTLFAHAVYDPFQTKTYPRLIPFVVSQSESYMIALYIDTLLPTLTSGLIEAYRAYDTFNRPVKAVVTGNHHFLFPANPPYYAEVDEVQWVQSVDVLTIVHPSRTPIRINRTAQDAFSVTSLPTTAANSHLLWPFRAQNATSISMTPSGTSGAITITANSTFFQAGHKGAMIKINHSGTIGAAYITAVTSGTVVNATVVKNFGATSGSASWWESAWSDYRGWPRSVCIYQGRMCYGGNATDRDSIWFSQTSNFDVMSVDAIVDPRTSPTGSQPFTIEISSQQLNSIQWLSPDKTLAVGTQGDEFIVQPEANQSFFGCDSAVVVAQSHYGSAFLPAVRVGSELLFVTPSQQVRSLVFNLLEDAYNSEPVQVLFDNYPKPELLTRRRKVRGTAWDESRNTLWCWDTAGNLYGLTRDRTLQVTTWHSHELGGFDPNELEASDPVADFNNEYGTLCSGSVISVAVTPNPTINMNDVWLTVRRKIGDQWQYHIERFMGGPVTTETVDKPALGASGNYFVDSCVSDGNYALTGSGTGESFVSRGRGLFSDGDYDHLVGKNVVGNAENLVGKGIFKLRQSFVNGNADDIETTVALVEPYPPGYDTFPYLISFGLPFQSIAAPVRLEAGSQIGTAQGAIKRIHKLTIRFFKTIGAKFGPSMDKLEVIPFRDGDTPMNESPELFTGDKTLDFDGDYDRDGYLYLVQDEPLPFAVTSIIAEGDTYD